MKLNNTRLLVQDFPACFRFYRDVLGLTPSMGDENDVYAGFPTEDGQVALFRAELMNAALGDAPTSTGGVGKSMLVFETPDVDETVRQLQAKGITFLTPPQDRPDWGIRTAHLRDPDGNLIEIYSDLPR